MTRSWPAVLLLALAVTVGAGASPARTTSAAASGCPTVLPAKASLLPAVVSVARRAEPRAQVLGVLSLSPWSLGTDDVWRGIAAARCGKAVATQSWVVFFVRPAWMHASASIAEGVSYIARTSRGLRVWYRYR
jgi:hypothetical protein